MSEGERGNLESAPPPVEEGAPIEHVRVAALTARRQDAESTGAAQTRRARIEAAEDPRREASVAGEIVHDPERGTP